MGHQHGDEWMQGSAAIREEHAGIQVRRGTIAESREVMVEIEEAFQILISSSAKRRAEPNVGVLSAMSVA